MSTDTAVMEPEDDAIVVHDDPVATEDNQDAAIAAKAAQMMESSEPKEKPPKADDEESAKKEEQAKEEAQKEPPKEEAALNDEMQARAEDAGIPEDLAKRLHSNGALEETLAAFDRQLIERFSEQGKGHEPKGQRPEGQEPRREQQPPREEPPELDPEYHTEELIRRDTYHKQRIDRLQEQLDELFDERNIAFVRGVDQMIDGLGHEELFGKGQKVPKAKQANRDMLAKAYEGLCAAYGVNPRDCDPQLGRRALAAVFSDELSKKTQQQTLDRLRDAEGKFASSPKPGAPPAKPLTEEETNDRLVAQVAAYAKEQGIKWSG